MVAIFLCSITLSVACVRNSPSTIVSKPVATPTPAPNTVGGILYEKKTALEVTEKPLSENKLDAMRMIGVTYASVNQAKVPGTLVLPPNSSKPMPTVLLLHGLGGSKKDLQLLQMALSGKGYASLAIDVAGHGERPKIGGKELGDLTLEEIRTTVAQTVQDLRRAVDYLETRKEVDQKRIGFMGVSLGSIIGGVFIGNEPRIACAALWAGGGDWGDLLTQSRHPFAQKIREKNGNDAEKINKILGDVDPLYTIGKFAPRPLYFLNGQSDTIVPPTSTEKLVRAAGRSPKLARLLLPGDHIPDLMAMTNQTLRFYDKFLKPIPKPKTKQK
jgi:dienelactone hydrolase